MKLKKGLKILIAAVLCIGVLLGAYYLYKNIHTKKVTIYLTGKGIATRLHKPLLDERSNIETKFIIIPEEPNTEDDLIVNENDWLFLGTPVYKHKPHLLYELKKFKKVLCEKPVGLSYDETEQIKKAIDENGVLFRVDYSLRFLPMLKDIQKFIDNNEVKSVKLTCNAGFNKQPASKDWKNDYNLGGGILYSIFPHLVDLLNYLGYESDLNSISFKSTSNIPMNDIKYYSKTTNNVDIEIDNNLCEDFDQFTLAITTPTETKTFDLINDPDEAIRETKYSSNTLSATCEKSPWRISFRYLLKSLFTKPNDPKLATIDDAGNVHKVIDIILLQAESQ